MRKQAKLERTFNRSFEKLSQIPELAEMYVFSKRTEGIAESTLILV